MCGQLVNVLKQLESKGDIAHDREILIIPSINNYGTNLSKSFWCLDNTDVNRTFPGNAEGETTERIAAGVFSEISAYQYGVQFASFYIPGVFIPHVRMMKTNKENAALANLFGLPYVILRTPNFLDQGTLNYNWQLGNTSAFSVYTNATESIDEESAKQGVSAVLRFLSRMGIIKYKCHGGFMGAIVDEDDMLNIKSGAAGIYRSIKRSGDEVKQGELLAEIIHPYEGEVIDRVTAPADGIIFFTHTKPLVMENNVIFKMIKRLHK